MVEDVVKQTISTYEMIAEDFDREHSDFSTVKPHADRFIQLLKGKRVLDIGCGPGRDAKYFTEQGVDITGIDLTPKFIEIASKKVPSAKFLLMDLRQLKFKDKSFDGIWCNVSFLHIPKTDGLVTLNGFARVMRKTAILYLSVHEGIGEKLVSNEETKGGQKFFSYYTQSEIESLLETAGFTIIDVTLDKKKRTFINVFAQK